MQVVKDGGKTIASFRELLPEATFAQKLMMFNTLIELDHPIHVRAAFDMDDTLVDFLPTCKKVMRKLNPNVGEIVSRESHLQLGMSLGEWFDHMNKIKMLHDLPAKGQGAAIAQLKTLTDYAPPNVTSHIEIFTSRSFYTDAKEVTANWLKVFDVVPQAIHIVPFGTSKADYMIENGIEPFHFFFDDVHKDCVECVEKGAAKRSLLVKMPWNENLELQKNVHRINCVSEFMLAEHLEILLC